jgi:ankyrin repeat protein
MALIYILSLKPNLESKDLRGLTPLHIAVNSAGKLGSTRCVKTLLITGSDREAKDCDGKTPRDWIQDDISDHMKAELERHLGK